MYFEWDESYSVSVDSMDAEHKVLFKMIDDFYENLRKPESSAALPTLIAGLKNYTRNHFLHEQRFLMLCEYPQYQQHVQKHQEFIAKIEEFETIIREGKPLLPTLVTKYLKDWLIVHIKMFDKAYAPYMLKKGLK